MSWKEIRTGYEFKIKCRGYKCGFEMEVKDEALAIDVAKEHAADLDNYYHEVEIAKVMLLGRNI